MSAEIIENPEPPSNPESPSKREIRELKSRSQRLDAHLKIGKAGVTDGFIRSLDEMLTLHELIKVKFVEFKDRKDELMPELAIKTRSHLIFRVGHVAVYYRKKPVTKPDSVESKRRIDGVRPR